LKLLKDAVRFAQLASRASSTKTRIETAFFPVALLVGLLIKSKFHENKD